MAAILKYLAGTLCLSFLLSQLCSAQRTVQQWDRFEVVLKHPYKGNAFTDVELTATFKGTDTSYTVAGFYDGDNTFRIRFMPQHTGLWQYSTHSNVPQLNNKSGSFECVKAGGVNHGMVKVSSMYNFKYADGKQYYPLGTTSYAWTHMGQELQEITLQTLRRSGFNKVRMCVFPKNYDLVKEEPEVYPFAISSTTKDAAGKEKIIWDLSQFNPAFFQQLEKRIDDLRDLGIEADLILFHPYDKGRWGFDSLPMAVNMQYLRYVTARLSSFRNVWWSVANEWDLVKYKTHADWDSLSKAVVRMDPYRHLCSIHGATASYFEYWKPEFTHTSIQDEAPVMNPGAAAILRNAYHKPVIYDEVGYEGNLQHRWGRYSGAEMTYLIWMGVIGGTYVTHGESYMFRDHTDTIFWAKGGRFKGSSWERVAFLRKILEEGPGPLEPADISRDLHTATAGKGYYIVYFGKEMRDTWTFNLPHKNAGFERPAPGDRFKVEIIDTWDMTIQECPLTFEITAADDYRVYDKNRQSVRLPLKPYIALRITRMPDK
jgi:hypothetical protein